MSSTAWVITVGYAVLTITPLPLIALALWHHSLAPILAFGLLLGFAAASFAVGVAFVNGWYPPERREFPHEHFKSRGTWPEAQRTAEPLSDRGPRRVVVRCDALEDGVGCSHQGHSPLLRIGSRSATAGQPPHGDLMNSFSPAVESVESHFSTSVAPTPTGDVELLKEVARCCHVARRVARPPGSPGWRPAKSR